MRIINLKVDFRGKKCVLYTGKYGNTTVHEKDSEWLKGKYKPLH